jgi:hypothetical protein
MSLVAALLAVAAALASGLGLAEQAFASAPRDGADRALRLTIALGLGTGAWALGFLVAIFAAGLSSPAIVAKDVLLLAGGLALIARARRCRASEGAPVEKPSAPAPRLLALLGAGVAVLAAGLVLVRVLAEPEGSWDALAIWNLRARFLLVGEGRQFLRAFSLCNTHPDYPLLVPACVAQGWRWLGETPVVGAGIGALFLLSTSAATGLFVARRRGNATGLGAALVLLGAPKLAELAAYQNADVPLASFVVLSLGLVALSLEEDERRRERLALAGFAAGLAAWTKNEGGLFLAGLVLGLALVRIAPGEERRARLRRVGDFIAGALPPLAALAWFKLALAPPNDIVGALPGAWTKVVDPSRPRLIAGAVLHDLTSPARWGPGVLVSPIVVGVFAREPRRRPAVLAGAVLLLVATVGFFFVYLVTPWPLAWHIDKSLDRLVAQVLPAWVMVAFLALPAVDRTRP